MRIRYEFVGWILCPYCGRNYIVKTNHYNGQPTHKHLMCYSNHQYKLCKSDNYPLDVFKQILTKQIKILKSNISSLNELLIDKFSKDEQEPIIEKIKALDSQIKSLRIKYNDIKDYHDDYFTSLQRETLSKIGELTKERTNLQNSISSKTPSERAKEIINKLKALPDDFENVENIDFKSVFAKAVIVDKGLIYFVIGDEELINPPLRPELFFKSSIEYKIRKSVFTTQFGVIINKD